MEDEAAEQYLGIQVDTAIARAYRERLQTKRIIESKQKACIQAEVNRRTVIAQSMFQGLVSVPPSFDVIECADDLKAMVSLMDEYNEAIDIQEVGENQQAAREFGVYFRKNMAKSSSALILHTTRMSAADKAIFRDHFNASCLAKEDMNFEERVHHLQQTMTRMRRVLPIMTSANERYPELKSNPFHIAAERVLSAVPDDVQPSILNPLNFLPEYTEHTHTTAGDWARFIMQTDNLGANNLIGLARGFTRPVDARDPSDWMSLFWEVAVSAPSSSLIRHDVNCSNQTLFSELDRASEILALSYRHRVHGDQSHGLRYRLPECCWSELRLVVESAVAGRPHGRVVLWWDQVLGATTKLDGGGVAWATFAGAMHQSQSCFRGLR
ncbi:hypothetical protein FGB62_31g01 [Gracilaria domingensis]|nr:hypothetical protein FGB62_31g01 [Gracilaria domingensis]